MRTTRLVLALAGIAALCSGCASTPEDQMAAWRARAVSQERFEQVLPFLKDLTPGDELRIFAGARQVFEANDGRPVVVIPSWITSLSGGAAGGLSMFGQLIGRSGDVIHGSHVFGYVSQGQIVPRYQVVTSATLVSAEQHAAQVEGKVVGSGVLPRPAGTFYFKDLHVAGARPLTFPDPGDRPPPKQEPPEGGLAAFYSEASFQTVAAILDDLPAGTDLFSMLLALGSTFVTHDYGETHSLLAPGFLRYKRVRTRSIEGPEGVIKLRPFGWVQDDVEVVKRIAIFENDRLKRVVHHVGLVDWASYWRE